MQSASPKTVTSEILSARGPRNALDPWRPYAVLLESEYSRFGAVEDVATIFLTNRECPFHCVFCDLWKNTLVETVPEGAIPAQIDDGLRQIAALCKAAAVGVAGGNGDDRPFAAAAATIERPVSGTEVPPDPIAASGGGLPRHLKLYNSGNFFDARAIPRSDWPRIAKRVSGFATVIVENHPRFCSEQCAEFQQQTATQLEVALGLETSHEATLASLNKQMTLQDFSVACDLLTRHGILIRVFVLLKPPDTSEEQGVVRALESIRFAFDCGAAVCSVIPVRSGNGLMDRLAAAGRFSPPRLSSLEFVLREALSWQRGRVFADLWDAEQFADDAVPAAGQIERLRTMNLTQVPMC